MRRVRGRKEEVVGVMGFTLEQVNCRLRRRKRVAVDMQCWEGVYVLISEKKIRGTRAGPNKRSDTLFLSRGHD